MQEYFHLTNKKHAASKTKCKSNLEMLADLMKLHNSSTLLKSMFVADIDLDTASMHDKDMFRNVIRHFVEKLCFGFFESLSQVFMKEKGKLAIVYETLDSFQSQQNKCFALQYKLRTSQVLLEFGSLKDKAEELLQSSEGLDLDTLNFSRSLAASAFYVILLMKHIFFTAINPTLK